MERGKVPSSKISTNYPSSGSAMCNSYIGLQTKTPFHKAHFPTYVGVRLVYLYFELPNLQIAIPHRTEYKELFNRAYAAELSTANRKRATVSGTDDRPMEEVMAGTAIKELYYMGCTRRRHCSKPHVLIGKLRGRASTDDPYHAGKSSLALGIGTSDPRFTR